MFPRTREEEGKAIAGYCLFCVVRDECEQYADEIGATWGIWGGRKRRRIRDES